MAGTTVERGRAQKVIAPGKEREIADSLLSRIFDSYRGYTRGSFADIVDDDFPSGGQSFVSGVENSFYSARPLDIEYFINTVIPKGDKLAVSFSWNKKDVPFDTGSQRKSRGQCLFVFKKSGEEWKLYDVKGNSPF
ncbi:MAG: hypothetical protein HQL30_04475 [Candidatus Omnitrophica bacterium]|nr:hypothetical protein [Candidatus Omnitrophota bacterium]